MGFLARAIDRKSLDPLAIWAEMLRAGRASKAGPTINLDNALKVATLFACLRVISQGVAQVPFKLYQAQTVDGLDKLLPARDHKLYDMMSAQPNDWQTSFEFREQLAIHAGLGNAYVWKSRVLSGWAEFILLHPGRMTVVQNSEFVAPTYKYSMPGGTILEFSADQIWHVRGPSWSGFAGLDVLQIAREALGLSMATEEAHSKLHANGVMPSGVYSVDGTLSADQHKQLVAFLKKEASAENSGNPLVLDRAAKWVSTAMTGVDSQHLETRKHQIEEVCRFVGVSPFMVFHTDKAPTYASAEQFQIQHVVHTLAPWYARIEQSADINLLTKQERNKGYYFKFSAAGLLRGAMKDQGEFFARMLGAGGTRQVLTQDEIRGLLEFNPLGGDAAVLHAPQGSQPGDNPPPPSA